MAARIARATALLLAVLLLHALALHWLGNQWRGLDALRPMAEPMFTRVLEPRPAPQPTPPKARPRKRPLPAPAAGITASTVAATMTAAAPASAPATPVEPVAEATAPAPATATATTVAPAPTVQEIDNLFASAPPTGGTATAAATATPAGTATTAAGDLSTWPPDTRLRYRLTGYWRGDLGGSGKVQWQRQDDRYQVEVELSLGIGAFSMTSQGRVLPEHLQPEAYVESVLGRRRPIAFGEAFMTMADGDKLPKPPLVQDTASQYIELSRRFAQTPDALRAGAVASVKMARPGGLDEWVYDIGPPEPLRVNLNDRPREVLAYRLSPRPLPNRSGYIFQEIWYAPSLDYLPVRIRVNLGDQGGYVQLDVVMVEQR